MKEDIPLTLWIAKPAYKYRQDCDYCGGYEEGLKPGVSFLGNLSGASMSVEVKDESGEQADKIRVCPKCLVKLFDAVLGARVK